MRALRILGRAAGGRRWLHLLLAGLLTMPAAGAGPALAQPLEREAETGPGGGEAALVLPDMAGVEVAGLNGRTLLVGGLGVCLLGLAFGMVIYGQVKALPAHPAMLQISELIYETCKTYLVTQGKFILILEVFIGAVIALYFGVLLHYELFRVALILLFSLIGIAGSYGVAWFGIRINTLANSRTAFASLRGRPFPLHEIPLRAGMSIGMML